MSFVANAIRSVTRAAKPVVKIAAPVVGGMLSGPIGAAAGGALASVATGGNRNDILRNAVTSGAAGAIANTALPLGQSPIKIAVAAEHALSSPMVLGGAALALLAKRRLHQQSAAPDAVQAPIPQQQSFENLQQRSLEATKQAFESFPAPRENNVFGTFMKYSPTAYNRELNFYNRKNFRSIRKMKRDILRQKMAAQLRKKISQEKS